MDWDEIRLRYPHQWLLIEALQARSEADQRILDKMAVIATYPNSIDAMHDYKEYHHRWPEREFYVLNTDRTDLDITERRWLGIRLSA